MIRISSLVDFLATLRPLGIEVTNERNSIVECVRLRQVDEKTTELTTIEPNIGVFTRLYLEQDANSFGDVNEEFLINYKDLVNTLEALIKGKATNCTLVLEAGTLLIYTDLQPKIGTTGIGSIEENYNYIDCRSLSIYPGEEDDFQYPEFLDERHIGYVKSDHFNLFNNILISFGQFKGTDEKYVNTVESGGKGIEFLFTFNSLNLFAHDKNQQVLLEGQIPFGSVEDDESITYLTYIEGRHLHRLIDLASGGESLDIFLLEVDKLNWICFQSTNGNVYVRLKHEDYQVRRKHEEFNQLKIEVENVLKEYGSSIQINGIELLNALNKQHSEKDKLLEKLVLQETEGIISVYPFHKASLQDKSKVTPNYIEGEWQDSCVNYKFISTGLSALAKFISGSSISPNIELTQYPFLIGGDLPVVLFYLTPLSEQLTSSITLFFVGSPAQFDMENEINAEDS